MRRRKGVFVVSVAAAAAVGVLVGAWWSHAPDKNPWERPVRVLGSKAVPDYVFTFDGNKMSAAHTGFVLTYDVQNIGHQEMRLAPHYRLFRRAPRTGALIPLDSGQRRAAIDSEYVIPPSERVRIQVSIVSTCMYIDDAKPVEREMPNLVHCYEERLEGSKVIVASDSANNVQLTLPVPELRAR